jgi:sulfatase maturation enzyme AslB (radical SAM superfamily)
MVGGQEFDSLEQMENSEWLLNIEEQMNKNVWPKECVRCQLTEETSNTSIRLDMLERHKILSAINKEYLIVGGVLDNICNSACQTCNAELSTKIGSLESSSYKKINNYENFFKFPQHRICEVDVNGGEPTASPNYKRLLKNLPSSVKIVRINTNTSKVIKEIEPLLEKGTRVIITMSFDGTRLIHDYTRWPIKWSQFQKNVEHYQTIRKKYQLLRLNFWSTLSCLIVNDIENILSFAEEQHIPYSYGFLKNPKELDISYSNPLTVVARDRYKNSSNVFLQSLSKKIAIKEDNTSELKNFIKKQDALRKINFVDYFKDSKLLF